jgi:hypothetical protein
MANLEADKEELHVIFQNYNAPPVLFLHLENSYWLRSASELEHKSKNHAAAELPFERSLSSEDVRTSADESCLKSARGYNQLPQC